jgi:hypothetical protein
MKDRIKYIATVYTKYGMVPEGMELIPCSGCIVLREIDPSGYYGMELTRGSFPDPEYGDRVWTYRIYNPVYQKATGKEWIYEQGVVEVCAHNDWKDI